jgi:signal transduction histidine kinase
LQQVLVNLVTNALESMGGLEGRPPVLTIRSAIERDEAIVTVTDSGHGIAPDELPHVFDSFYTTKPSGIGVGLAISRSIIEAHGGAVSAAPGELYGARFGFALPMATEPQRSAGERTTP